jgi:hypothetical protein
MIKQKDIDNYQLKTSDEDPKKGGLISQNGQPNLEGFGHYPEYVVYPFLGFSCSILPF